jgi:hypothetical protein
MQAFSATIDPADVPLELGRRDPVMAMLREHLQAEPLPRGQRALIARFSLAGASGEAPSPAAAAMWLDTKRAYLELRPQLRRRYVPAVAPENRRLMFDGRPVELSPLELDLLVHLRRREGVIVTRRGCRTRSGDTSGPTVARTSSRRLLRGRSAVRTTVER